MSNLELWSQYATPEKHAIKEASIDGHKIMSISGAWFDKAATEAFGPAGIGWGWEVLEERLDDGEPFLIWLDKEANIYQVITAKTHTIKLKLWYVLDGIRGEVINYGHTKQLYKSKWGATNDPEAPKKSMTDAKKKCLSALGFASTIFEGLMDNPEFAETVMFDQMLQKSDSSAEAQMKIDQEISALREGTSKHISLINQASSKTELMGIMLFRRTLEARSQIPALNQACAALITRFDKACAERSEQLRSGGK